MKKEMKEQVIAAIKANLAQYPNFYIVNIEGLNAEQTATLRRDCFNEGIKLNVVKNTLFMSPSLRLVSMATRSPGFSIAGPEVMRMFTPISLAMTEASVVLPSPGGP